MPNDIFYNKLSLKSENLNDLNYLKRNGKYATLSQINFNKLKINE